MTYDELRGKLLAYETLINNTLDREKKDVVFKSKISKLDDESDDSFSDDELEFLARKLRRLMRSKGRNRGSSSSKEYKKKKMKVLMEYWKDLENESDSEDEDEQEAQVCFMVDNEVIDEISFNELSNDDLQVVIDDLDAHANKLLDKYNICKSEKEVLKAENDFLKEKLRETESMTNLVEQNRLLSAEIEKFKEKKSVIISFDLIIENEKLHERIKSLNQDLEQFAHSSSNLDKLLAYQRSYSEKFGLGYSGGSDAVFENKFVKSKASTSNTKNPSSSSNVKISARRNYCDKCNRHGYSSPQCFVFEKRLGDKVYKIVSDFNAFGQPRRTNIKGSK
ncbi:hypothetical protein PIB30_078236 [Stylosanthes scabra]|uniref:Uncharacterized protein n=1 Tax=Stylosanthes scabra TaxID=79078 RepID=A0ABU6RQV2_9FABA|nr:hypothetical protein [Stylosanthes scabra]